MSEHIPSNVKYAASGLAGFALILTVGGSLYVISHGGTPAASRAPAPASPTTLAAVRPLSAPEPVARAAASAPPSAEAASPAPILPESAREEPASAPAAEAVAVAPGRAAPKLKATAHLEVAHQASVSAAVAENKTEKTAKAEKKAFVPPKLDLSRTQSAVASSVHYGVNSRAELMGRAAGPVYNFSGKKLEGSQNASRSAGGSAGGANMDSQVEQAQAQLDATPLDDHDKAVVKEQLRQVRETAAKATGQ